MKFLALPTLLLLSTSAFADVSLTWVEQASKEVQEIKSRPTTIHLNGIQLRDDRDGLHFYQNIAPGNNTGELKRIFSPSEIAGLSGDRHTLGFAKVDGLVISDCVLEARQVAEALKFSASKNVVVENCHIIGSKEDAVDIVRGDHFYFINTTFESTGDQAVTIKASANHIRFINCRFIGKTKNSVYIDLGNWSDYDIFRRPRTGDVAIDTATSFSEAGVYPVQTIYAHKPEFSGKVWNVPDLFVDLFFIYQRIANKKKVLKKYSREELLWGLPPEYLPDHQP